MVMPVSFTRSNPSNLSLGGPGADSKKNPAGEIVSNPAYYKNNNSFGIKIGGAEKIRAALPNIEPSTLNSMIQLCPPSFLLRTIQFSTFLAYESCLFLSSIAGSCAISLPGWGREL